MMGINSNNTRFKAITDKDSKEAMILRYQQTEIRKMDQNAMLSMLKSRDGRWFIMRMLDSAGVNSQSFTGNSTTFYNEGKRQIGLELLARIQELGIEAVKLKQKAELEYIEHQLKARDLAIEYTDNHERSNI